MNEDSSYNVYSSMVEEKNSAYETVAFIFLTAIKSARRNPGFSMLSRKSQNISLGKYNINYLV